MAERSIAIKPIYCFALIVFLLLPAIVNGRPFLYPDSVGYFHSGYSFLSHLNVFRRGPSSPTAERALSLGVEGKDSISTARSVYYGAIYAASYLFVGEWMLVLLQVGITAFAIVLAARKLRSPHWFIAVILLTQLAGLCVFSDTIMPDLFTGLLLLAFASVIAYSTALSRLEATFWIAVALVSCLFHKSNVVILGLTWVTVAPFVWHTKKKELLAFGAVFIGAILAHLAVTLAVKEISGEWPADPPFVLARMIGDGTAVEYLRKTCPTHHYAVCDYLHEMPLTEVQFLWGREHDKAVMGTASRQMRKKIDTEAFAIEMGTLGLYPFQQLERSIWNTLKQFTTVGVTEFKALPTDDVGPIASYQAVLKDYKSSAIAAGWMPLGAISTIMTLTYAMSLVAISWLLSRSSVAGFDTQTLWFVVTLLVGLAQNAFVCGAISGVFDRYQGRVAWLAPLALIALYSQRGKAIPNSPPDFSNSL